MIMVTTLHLRVGPPMHIQALPDRCTGMVTKEPNRIFQITPHHTKFTLPTSLDACVAPVTAPKQALVPSATC